MLTRVAYVSIVADDLEGALRFYRDTLGLPATLVEDGSWELPVGGSAIHLATQGEGQPAGIDALAFEAGGEAPCTLPPEDHLGLGIRLVPSAAQPAPVDNGVTCIDHVVISSNDSAATAAHFHDRLGLEIKRTMTRPGTGAHLEFAKLGDVILEFAGPPEPRPGPLQARWWGMVFAVRNLDATLARVTAAGYPVTDPRPAVQPGARIATVKAGTGGVPFALIEYGPR